MSTQIAEAYQEAIAEIKRHQHCLNDPYSDDHPDSEHAKAIYYIACEFNITPQGIRTIVGGNNG